MFAGLAYCVASASMVLLNKLALSSFNFHSLTMLLIFQCLFCVVAVRMTAIMGFITLEVCFQPLHHPLSEPCPVCST